MDTPKGVRAARIQTAAPAAPPAAGDEVAQASDPARTRPQTSRWNRYLKLAICFGAPLLAVLILAGGGGALLGTAGALLPVLALLACPLAMFVMMWAMARMGHQQHRRPREGATRGPGRGTGDGSRGEGEA
jgi:hypothetical protein